MSDFRFLCPECGQKILGDTAYSGSQIACPTCQKTITIPSATAAAPASPPPAPIPQPVAWAASASPARVASGEQTSVHFSGLAAASLICSVVVPIGSVPGVICGHMAKAQMRRSVFLGGEKMANAGLLISYCVLLATLALTGTFFLADWHFSPVKVVRESPAAVAALQPRIVDEVIAGENEDDHDMDGQMLSMMSNNGKTARAALRGGSFSYTMKVVPREAMTLNCRYWGGERKDHVFDVAVDNQIIATQNLASLAPGHFVDMEYKIPASLTRGKNQVKVEFQAHAGKTAGGLYACQILKR
jgi:hypothetical protein